jgi:hypothetical protein
VAFKADGTATNIFRPEEDLTAVFHNPGMGWVLDENYPLDPVPGGTSTLVTLPGERFPEVDAVAVMFSWQDVEATQGNYDFAAVDFACAYWRSRGKEIQLRMSTEPLMFHVPGHPRAGAGVPSYILEKLPPHDVQERQMEGSKYTVVNALNKYYQKRLEAFLRAVNKHFQGPLAVTVIDLRGFGVWGEWHSGFKYERLEERRRALQTILDIWSRNLAEHPLALSYSYDPDGPKSFYAGATEKFDAASTTNYGGYLAYSAFDHALKKENVTFRRDGCGGAIHSNERKLSEEAFFTYKKAPILAEFLGGYASVKAGGTNWVSWMVEDALSQHPNYLNLIGWVGEDARNFVRERPDLIARGLTRMGYRLVPTEIRISNKGAGGHKVSMGIDWVNRGAGRSLQDFDLEILLASVADPTAKTKVATERLRTSQWMPDGRPTTRHTLRVAGFPGGEYLVTIRLSDPITGRCIAMPLRQGSPERGYEAGNCSFGKSKSGSYFFSPRGAGTK